MLNWLLNMKVISFSFIVLEIFLQNILNSENFNINLFLNENREISSQREIEVRWLWKLMSTVFIDSDKKNDNKSLFCRLYKFIKSASAHLSSANAINVSWDWISNDESLMKDDFSSLTEWSTWRCFIKFKLKCVINIWIMKNNLKYIINICISTSDKKI